MAHTLTTGSAADSLLEDKPGREAAGPALVGYAHLGKAKAPCSVLDK